jgi:hypothetical protein
MWYINTMKYYSGMKESEIMSFIGKWMELEITILSKISQVGKVKFFIFSLIY